MREGVRMRHAACGYRLQQNPQTVCRLDLVEICSVAVQLGEKKMALLVDSLPDDGYA